MDFFNKTGKAAIGSRLRMLTETIMEDAARIHQLYGSNLQPKWFPVYYVLTEGDAKTITAIAKEIGHSHPSVSKIIGEMKKAGLVAENKDKADGRRNLVQLTKKGLALNETLQLQLIDVGNAIEAISAQTTNDLWKAIAEWEYLLEQQSLISRVTALWKKREADKVKIVDYQPAYKTAFKALNEEWISRWFKMEAADYQSLDNPEGYILKKGGHIFVALFNDEPVGVCALIKMDDPDYDYEMAKMAVSPKAQGKSIGWLLGQAIIEKARSLGARNVFLESNTILKPAISLYEKLGFKKVVNRPSPYERANIQMALDIV
ncbi:MarR family transcriptional regulator with acetyltransferase activity [Chitinophaga polysaccharea]|uniref:MarR family transcriptional regulator with acetyltransferase activity n=1 Tax=Chitinophaga polysaccharea TaxID=1293035 RepID=A0A561PU85_9BACT|nr:bifunctional helix-turn-helix transcriptional regulator/GNAT family N-acetyltransferase [Chitinophaga polysaccharea]TWF41685.1 MarR family transcriptional regulator with acetyltransferase activity [Chitinophaga polysaccharea]